MRVLILVVLGMCCGNLLGAEKSVGIMLEEAQYQEETVGDVNAAIGIYEAIVKSGEARRPEAAKALYRYGVCLVKKGDKQKAAELFEKVMKEYYEQKVFAMKAQRELEKMGIDAQPLTIVGKWNSVDFVSSPEDFEPGVKKFCDELYLKEARFNADGSSSIGMKWKNDLIIHTGSKKSSSYYLKYVDGETYLFFPWMNGDVIDRGEKPKYYVLKSAGSQKKIKTDKHDQDVVDGITAARGWLAIVDNGEYGKGWDEAAGFLKGTVNKTDLEKSFEAVRKPLGAVKSREVNSATYTKAVPGAPDGQYIVIQFKTVFENKDGAVETVTLMLDADSKWRVSGYYIK